MATAPDLMGLLSLDPNLSQSPFGGSHRFILIEKDYTNSGDFVFNNLLQHFGRREPNTQILLIAIGHNWMNYSVSAAKCGFNLRKKQNMGNIEVLSLMDQFLANITDPSSGSINFCDYILESLLKFLDDLDNESATNPTKAPVVMIDDLSLLLTIGTNPSNVSRMILEIEKLLRNRSHPSGRLSHLVVQTMFTNIRAAQQDSPDDGQLNFLIKNLENICDLQIILRPLETGHSTRVDGTITFIDNRLPLRQNSGGGDNKPGMLSNILSGASTDIGTRRAYFYKLSDRRVRLTSSAFLF